MSAPAAEPRLHTSSSTDYRLLTVVVLAWFFLATLYAAFYIELGFDPAYHATVAKNFATGYGWASSYDRPFPFNPDVTTGPAMLLPAAAMIALTGNALWVPGLSAALLHLAFYALILLRLRPYFESAKQHYLAVMALTLFFGVYAHTWWLSLTADFLVCLGLWLASLYIVMPDPKRRSRHLFYGGVALGYAVLAKALAAFGVAGLLLYMLLARRAAREYWSVLLGMLLLVVPWTLYQTVSLSGLDKSALLERSAYAREFFMTQGTGLSELAATASVPALLGENLLRNGGFLIDNLKSRYGIPVIFTIAAMCGLFLGTLRLLRRRETPMQELLLALGLIASGQLLWYLLLSLSWNSKYALAPVVLGGVMLCITLAARPAIWALMAILVLSPLWLPVPTRDYVWTLASFGARENDYMRDMRTTRDYLIHHAGQRPLAGCGWVFAPWEFEYAMPGHQHFRDCRTLIADALSFDEAYYLDQHPEIRGLIAEGRYASALDHFERTGRAAKLAFRYVWKHPLEFDLVANHVFWNSSPYRAEDLPVLKACSEHPLHRTQYFSVLRCTADALQKTLALDQPSPFLPPSQPQHFIHKPAPLR